MSDLLEFKAYLTKVAGLSSNTARSYTALAEKYINFIAKPPEEATVKDILKYMEYIYDNKYSQSTQICILSAIRALYDYYMTQGIIDYNPARMIKRRYRTPVKLPEVLHSIEEVEKIIRQPLQSFDQYTGKRDASVIATLASTGIRVSELCNIKPEDFDPTQNSLRIFGKGSKERIVPVIVRWFSNPDEILYLVKYYIYNVSHHMYPRKVCYIVHRASKRAIGRRVNPHIFRHTFATQLIKEGVDISTVQQILGHSSIVTTQKYVHLAYKDVVDKLKEKGLFI